MIRPPPRPIMCRTAHQVPFAAPVRLTASVACQAACHCSYDTSVIGCGGEDARVVHQHIQAAKRPAGLVHQLAHRFRVGQIGLHRHVAAAGQARQHRGGGPAERP